MTGVGAIRERWARCRWWAEAPFSGLAQVFFCNHPATGIGLLAALFLLAPAAGLGATLGVATATALAAALRWNRFLLRAGLFGFNGALTGLVWPSLFPVASAGFLAVVPAAAVATWLYGRWLPWFSRRDLPVLGNPFVLVVWGAVLFAGMTGMLLPPRVALPDMVGPAVGWDNPALVRVVRELVVTSLPGALVIGLSLWLSSPWTFGLTALGLATGLATTLALGGLAGALWVGAYAYTAAPVTLAVAGVFFPLTRRSLLLGIGAAAIGVLAWLVAVRILLPFGLFPLTAPLNLVVLSCLGLARWRADGGLLGVRPRPLSAASPPARTLPPSPAPSLDEDPALLVGLIRGATRIVALSGAGMSTESGVPDYRSKLGFWYDANPEDLTLDRYLASSRSRRLYWRLHRRFTACLRRAAPNAGHRFLVELERRGQLLGIITQNVDGLHLTAGSSPDRVVELHGNARRLHCLGCGVSLPSPPTAWLACWETPRCPSCRGLLKVATVSVGESLPAGAHERAVAWLQATDLSLVLGTSLAIEPAGLLPGIVHARGVPVVVINDAPTPLDPWAGVVIRAPVGKTLDRVREALRRPIVERLIRPMTRTDFIWLCQVVDLWWGDSVRYLLHPLFLEHFSETCFVVEEGGILAGFLVGFVSQASPEEAYVHLVATAPTHRGKGLGRALYAHFFELVRQRGCRKVTALTVPYNPGSLAFHARMGFSYREAGAVWCDGLPIHMNYAGPGVHCVIMEKMLT